MLKKLIAKAGLIIGIPFVLILLPLCKIATIATKLFLYWFIIIGGLDEITGRKYNSLIFTYLLMPLPQPAFEVANALVSYWVQCAVLIIFIQSWHRKKIFDELMQTNSYSKMFIATIMTYFQIQVETKEVVALQKGEGLKHLMDSIKNTMLLGIIGGGLHDSALDAYPVRGKGNRASFAEDIKSLLQQKE